VISTAAGGRPPGWVPSLALLKIEFIAPILRDGLRVQFENTDRSRVAKNMPQGLKPTLNLRRLRHD
jgi:hypothetical protein